jgi:D-beta-D-heptose 7-phosphate kinase/D-beta-D-heptose 1-phosphate adenosyltransferase
MKIVVNGTFDILHRGHIEMLEYAKSLGNNLLVCIDTDNRVKELKGPDRPINNQTDRAFMLNSLKCVNDVWYFNSEEELEYILETYQPDIMVKGSDYRGKPIVGAHLCKEIRFYELVPNYSTTNTIKNIINRG